MQVSTCFALSKGLAVVELLRGLLQVQKEIPRPTGQLIQLRVAAFAVPGIAFRLVGSPDPFHHQADGVRRPLRRMRAIGRQQEHFSLPDRLAPPPASIVDILQHHVTFQLVEKFLAGIDVKVSAGVGTTDDHDDELGVFPDHLRPDWRLQQITVLIDPALEVERFEKLCHVTSPLGVAN